MNKLLKSLINKGIPLATAIAMVTGMTSCQGNIPNETISSETNSPENSLEDQITPLPENTEDPLPTFDEEISQENLLSLKNYLCSLNPAYAKGIFAILLEEHTYTDSSKIYQLTVYPIKELENAQYGVTLDNANADCFLTISEEDYNKYSEVINSEYTTTLSRDHGIFTTQSNYIHLANNLPKEIQSQILNKLYTTIYDQNLIINNSLEKLEA